MEDSLSRGHSAGQALEARLPDEITMCKFRHQLKAHEMGTRNPQLIQQHQAGQSLRPRHGTVLDATLLDAPTPTKNQTGQRDPEKRSTIKGRQWYFGTKLHIVIDHLTGLFHHLVTTPIRCMKVNWRSCPRMARRSMCGSKRFTSARRPAFGRWLYT